jgi:hypothetical protein
MYLLLRLLHLLMFNDLSRGERGFRMPRLETHTACPGCGRMIEIRENDPDFFEARFRTGGAAQGADARKIPGRCPVCGGPLTRKKRGRTRGADHSSEVSADEPVGGGRRRRKSLGTIKLFGHRVPVWALIAAVVFVYLMFQFLFVCGLPRIHWQRVASAPPSPGPPAWPAGPPSAPPSATPSPPPPAPAPPPPAPPDPVPPPAPASPGPVPPPATQFPGLLGYWSLDEGQGDRAADSSGTGLDAKVFHGRWVDGVRGKALYLRGKGCYLDYGDSPRLSFAAHASFTLAFWAQTRRDRGTLLSHRHEANGVPVIDILIDAGRLSAMVRKDGTFAGGPVTLNGGKVGDGAWHHVALARDGDTLELFLDGVSQAKQGGPEAGGAITTNWRTLGSERYWIDRSPGPGEPTFEGNVDEFCAFGRALKADEVRALAGH